MLTPSLGPTYVVLRTVADGAHITGQATDRRIVHTATEYTDALRIAREHRRYRYLHRRTGETRVYRESDTAGSPWAQDQSLFQWVSGAKLIEVVEYALPMSSTELIFYEPDTAR